MIQFRDFQSCWLERRQLEAANQTASSISISLPASTIINNILVIDLTNDSHLATQATTRTDLNDNTIIITERLEDILETLALVEQ
ncbi:unnamed protein product [Rotaria magnacalcarata]|uniref:Uncharacterized protein n=1 Tax=Rotaria magnacalcarata TaxID=392030 RepID=A0A819UW40_9BILA|nr:unnamed protein product [Rotaria magnacalcarata]CAF4103731.1 unnamed protein product [Rotaria magnacalcarata]